MTHSTIQRAKRFARRFFSAPFEHLPPEYGNQVPPDLRVFEAKAEISQKEVREETTSAHMHDHRSAPARLDESLERE